MYKGRSTCVTDVIFLWCVSYILYMLCISIVVCVFHQTSSRRCGGTVLTVVHKGEQGLITYRRNLDNLMYVILKS